MKQIIFLLILLFCSNLMKSQIPKELEFGCNCESHNDVSRTAMSGAAGCSYIDGSVNTRNFDVLFIPSSNYSPYTIQVNLIFIQRNDGSGNFQENDLEHKALWNEIEKAANLVYQNLVHINDPSCYTGSTYVDDAKIRFKFNRYYMKNETGWDNKGGPENLCPYIPNWYLNAFDNTIVNNLNIPRGINVYFTEDKKNYMDLVVNRTTNTLTSNGMACSDFPDFSNYTATTKTHMPNLYTKYWYMKNICPQLYGQPWDPVIRGWFLEVSKGLAHELGHALWLYHKSIPHYGENQCYYSIFECSSGEIR